MSVDAMGVPVSGYDTIIIFRDQEQFHSALWANPHMDALCGENESEVLMHGVYIAGIRANSQEGKTGGHLPATQK